MRFDIWDSYVDSVLNVQNPVLKKHLVRYLNVSQLTDSLKETLIDVCDKVDKLKENETKKGSELHIVCKDAPVNFDCFLTYDQLFDIIPIEYFEKYEKSVLRKWKLNKIL